MNEAERKIKVALRLAVDFKNDGDDPNTAVSKAASLEKLNPDMTERVVQGFNIALTNATLKNASDKTAAFPIADLPTVMERVFGHTPAKNDKTASAVHEAFFAESKPVTVRVGWESGMQKAAAAENPEGMVRQVHGACELARHEVSKIAQDVMCAENKVQEAFVNMVDLLSNTDMSGKFAMFEMQARSEYGDDIIPVIDNLYEAGGLDRFNEPRFVGSVKIASDYFPSTPVYSAFDRLMEATNAYHKAVEEGETKQAEIGAEISSLVTLMHEALPETRPFPKLGEDEGGPSGGRATNLLSSVTAGLPSRESLSPFSSDSRMIPSAVGGVSKGLGDQYAKAHSHHLETLYKGPKDEVANEMNNVRRGAIIRELMTNDDVISKMDPSHLQEHYNALLTIAPDLTLQPSVVRGWLRHSAASQAVDPFTAKQLADLQGQVSKNKLIATGQVKPTV